MKKRAFALLLVAILLVVSMQVSSADTINRNYSAGTLYNQYTFWANASYGSAVKWTSVTDTITSCPFPVYKYAFIIGNKYYMDPTPRHPFGSGTTITISFSGSGAWGKKFGLTIYNPLGGSMNMPVTGHYTAYNNN